MDLAWTLAASGFAFAMAGTPGPNNTMVTASGANYGFRRTLPVAMGMAIGVAVIIFTVAAAGGAVVADPRVHLALKWIGIVYLLWLAWRIATAPVGLSAESSRQRPFTFVEGALLQLVNPKLWVMVAGAVVAYGGGVAGDLSIPSAFAVIFGGATLVSTLAWAGIGVGAGRFMTEERSLKLFNRAMALLLVLSLVPVVFD
ncbi:LysE family translocator [Shinella zoogloeoides]|uniref:LysE family transporter n=1 Tax=Shinella zoogloeoides TaxID=352475 RepID=A0A6N8TJ70_SHIZO|nr:LysE family translocator [Shinella zoogloeoides]MXO02276.1 LysE family transporter [Shinella zoogloeoides]UEX82026.1 LysE family translocator [Shinella zoogloeoides]